VTVTNSSDPVEVGLLKVAVSRKDAQAFVEVGGKSATKDYEHFSTTKELVDANGNVLQFNGFEEKIGYEKDALTADQIAVVEAMNLDYAYDKDQTFLAEYGLTGYDILRFKFADMKPAPGENPSNPNAWVLSLPQYRRMS
jgi:hypothetical protein